MELLTKPLSIGVNDLFMHYSTINAMRIDLIPISSLSFEDYSLFEKYFFPLSHCSIGDV
jgi:hypothetical protein